MKSALIALALICMTAATLESSKTVVDSSSKHVTNYFLIDEKVKLTNFMTEMTAVNNKVNFNRIVLAFIQPSIHSYVTGNLACTGILGYYCDNRNSSDIEEGFKAATNGTADFTELKAAIATFKKANIEVFISVGGWDYNCRQDLYCETLKWYNKSSSIVCEPPHYSHVCEPMGYSQKFDYFPDPSNSSIADGSYTNVVKLASDLGCDGIDLDYEEFWHADYYRRTWKQEDFISAFRSKSSLSAMQSYYDGLTYDEVISQYASAQPNRDASSVGPFVLPDTVEKVYRIMQALKKAGPQIKFSFAGPAVGGIPIMVPQYGDSNSLKNGGVWWGGNLKGLLYSLVQKYGTSILSNWDIGLMTYDLGCRDGIDCGKGLPFKCSLQDQVSFYATTYKTYMQGSNEAEEVTEGVDDFKQVKPKYFNVPGMSTMFGFEIGRPAYPAYDDSWKKLVCRESDVTGLLSSIGDQHSGLIIWETFKQVDGTFADEASTKYIDSQACQHYNLGSDYDCNANIPTKPAVSNVETIESLFLH